MKIYFEKICYQKKPLVWHHDIETNKAIWTGRIAGASKSPLPRDVQREIRGTEGIEEEGLTLIIKNVDSFKNDNGDYKQILDESEIQSPRKLRQGFFQEPGSPVPILATSSKSSSDSKITRVSGSPVSTLATSAITSSSSSSEAIIKKIPTKDLSFASLIPDGGELWKITMVYEESMDKAVEDQKNRQCNMIKSIAQLIKEGANERVRRSSVKKEIMGAIRQLFDDILNPTLNKIRGEDSTLPALITYFRSVIREIMIEPPLTPLIREERYSSALSPEYTRQSLRKKSIKYKLTPLYFFIKEDVQAGKLTEDAELRQHLQWIKVHVHPDSQEIASIIERLHTLLWELSETQDAFSMEKEQLKKDINDHLPIKEFMSFYSLLEQLKNFLSSIPITPISKEKKRKKEISEELLADLIMNFPSNTMPIVISRINQEFRGQPTASGQIAMIWESSDFYISPSLYASLLAGLKSVLSKALLARKDLTKTASDWMINHITAHLAQELKNQRIQREKIEQQSPSSLSMSC